MSACPRLWQVEAARDGRLTGKDLASTERHWLTCAECRAEQRALAELGRHIANVPSHVPDPLARRRARQRLLGSWNEHVLRGASRSPSRRIAIVLASAAAFMLATSAVLLTRPKSATHLAERSLVQVTAGADARWTERHASGEDRVSLTQGFASFSVGEHERERVFIDVPDGEIEDLGTVFEVEVRDRRTTHVSVRQGEVFVRLRARAAFALKAGESWESEPTDVATGSAAPSAVAPRAAAPIITPPAVAASVRAKPSHEPAASPSSAKPEPTASTHSDSAEDDAYLHIVDLLRNGHGGEAEAQAERYLARFPNGFRRPEVQSILARKKASSARE